ncbi:MAG: hypothetical protein AB1730_02725 [Myxococcota bacterium]
MAVDLEEELQRVTDALASEHVPYALCGGLALAVHGFPRATKAIDLLVRDTDLPSAFEALARAHFTLRSGPIPLGVRTSTPQTLHRASRIIEGVPCTVDLLCVSASYQAAWDSKLTVEWRGRPLQVVSREGLVAMKRLSSRLKDQADVAALEGRDEE